MKEKYQTKIITSDDQVPSDYVPVNNFRTNGFVGRWATIAKAISEAHSNGHIRAVKLCRTVGDLKTGLVYVHEGDCTAFLNERYSEDRIKRKPKAVEHARAAEANEAVERLAAAAADVVAAMADLTAALRLRAEETIEGPQS